MMAIKLTDKQFAMVLEQDRILKLRANPPEVLNVQELALVTDFHADTIYQKVAEGTIPHKKDGRRIIFIWDSIKKWLIDGESR